MGTDQNFDIDRSLGEVDSNPYEEFNISMEEVTGDVTETVRELEFNMEPEDVTKLLQSQDKTLTNVQLLLRDEQRKCFFR